MLNKAFIKQTICNLSAALLLTGGVSAQTPHSFNFVSPAASDQKVEFDVFLPLENTDQLDQLLAAQQTKGSASYHKWITPEEFKQRFGPNPAALEKVESELKLHGLSVTAVNSHGLHVQGTASSVREAFGVPLWNGRNDKGVEVLVAQGALSMPAALSQMGAVVPAFSPLAPRHVHARNLGVVPENRYSNVGPYWFTDIKEAYQLPSYEFLTGKGRTVAIVMSSDVLDSDLNRYFGHEKLKPPKVVRHPVAGGPPPFSVTSIDSFEASLDVQQAGGMAPGATIALYDVPDLSDPNILAAYLTIVEDNEADIVSSSFGAAELYYTGAYNGGMDYTYLFRLSNDVFKQGNAQGITFVASSGDAGGFEAQSVDGKFYVPAVSNPASDPNVTGVGGTNLVTTYKPGSLDSTYVRENAIHDQYAKAKGVLPNQIWGSGGGKSIVFGKPAYQDLLNTGSTTRSVPDISMQMGGCPTIACGSDRSAVITAVGGQLYGLIGTSVSAPEFAGLLALEEEHLGTRLGNVNYQIYAQSAEQQVYWGSAFFHQGIPSNNGTFKSPEGKKGYNMIVGNGTPIGINFIMAPATPVAGTPKTPSNP